MNLTTKQSVLIEKKLLNLWNDEIYENILTDAQKPEGVVDMDVLFDMEQICEKFGADFGIGGISSIKRNKKRLDK